MFEMCMTVIIGGGVQSVFGVKRPQGKNCLLFAELYLSLNRGQSEINFKGNTEKKKK